MDLKEMLKEVGKLVLSTDIKFAEAKLADGTIIRVEEDEFQEGAVIALVTEDGLVPLPVGEYDLGDGRLVIVEEEGIIASIKEAEEADEEANVEASEVKFEEESNENEVEADEEVEVEEADEEVETDESNIESRLSMLEEVIKEIKDGQSKIAEATLEMSKQLKDQGNAPIVDNFDEISKFSQHKKDYTSKVEKRINRIQEIKENARNRFSD